VLFDSPSPAFTIATLVIGILPVVVAYLVILIRWRGHLALSHALGVTMAYLIVYLGMTLLHTNFAQILQGEMSMSNLALIVVFIGVFFPALVLTIVFSTLTLLAWKVRIARLALLITSLLMQALYVVNLTIVLLGGEIIKF
jgi:hypothetical protein